MGKTIAMTTQYGLGLALLALVATTASAEVVTRAVEYEIEGETYIGYLAYDDALEGDRPGVLVIHEWWGLNDYAKMRAEQLADMGYVAFAADMYGDGAVATERAEAGQLAGTVRGTPLMRSRANAALEVLAAQEGVDSQRLAAIGFCFGGTGVLELAYSGAPLAGVVSFHGGLVNPQEGDEIQAAILVEHGAIDPHVPPERVAEFEQAMEAAGVDWQLVAHGGAVHAFTNPAAGDDPSRGVAYHEAAATRSWQQMQLFFHEIFAE